MTFFLGISQNHFMTEGHCGSITRLSLLFVVAIVVAALEQLLYLE
jgi:hypothetical protein